MTRVRRTVHPMPAPKIEKPKPKRIFSMGKHVREDLGLDFCFEGVVAGRIDDDWLEKIEKSGAKK